MTTTMDWDAEAKCVASAFGIEEECVFRLNEISNRYEFIAKSRTTKSYSPSVATLPDGSDLRAEYSGQVNHGCKQSFYLHKPGMQLFIAFNWDNTIAACTSDAPLIPIMKKALLELGLLTPEIEEALRSSPTSKVAQKVAQVALWDKQINWKSEANRIAIAFGLEGEYEFVKEEILGIYGTRREFNIVNGEEDGLVPLDKDTSMSAYYSDEGVGFFIASAGFSEQDDPHIEIWIPWNGSPYCSSSDEQAHTSYRRLLARPLLELDLLTPEVEAALKLSISAHEKVEWLLEQRTKDLD